MINAFTVIAGIHLHITLLETYLMNLSFYYVPNQSDFFFQYRLIIL